MPESVSESNPNLKSSREVGLERLAIGGWSGVSSDFDSDSDCEIDSDFDFDSDFDSALNFPQSGTRCRWHYRWHCRVKWFPIEGYAAKYRARQSSPDCPRASPVGP